MAATGTGLAANEISGKGGVGKVTGGRKVNFSNPIVSDYCQEIAADENNHVKFLRSALGSQVVGRPAIDIGAAFTTAAQAAGVIGAGQTFDPYADDASFLLGAYIFEDVGVTAYSGAAPFITDKGLLAAAAGILAVEAYHAGLVRAFLFAQQSSFITGATAQISNLRATLSGKGVNDDQGIGADQSTIGGGPATPANIVPTDANSLAYARTPREVSNIVFGKKGATAGLFFPSGLSGDFGPIYKV
jgi:Ferritin-like domain